MNSSLGHVWIDLPSDHHLIEVLLAYLDDIVLRGAEPQLDHLEDSLTNLSIPDSQEHSINRSFDWVWT